MSNLYFCQNFTNDDRESISGSQESPWHLAQASPEFLLGQSPCRMFYANNPPYFKAKTDKLVSSSLVGESNTSAKHILSEQFNITLATFHSYLTSIYNICNVKWFKQKHLGQLMQLNNTINKKNHIFLVLWNYLLMKEFYTPSLMESIEMKSEKNLCEERKSSVFVSWQKPVEVWMRPLEGWRKPVLDWEKPICSWLKTSMSTTQENEPGGSLL